MTRILVLNPNSDRACTAAIDAAIAPFRTPGGPAIDVMTLVDGPPAVLSWQDWHAAALAASRAIAAADADAYVIACASDPGVEAARAVTDRPVFGAFRCAVAAAAARAERFGVIAIVDASVARHRAALRAMGLEGRLAGEVALNVGMAALLDPAAARTRLIEAARTLAAMGAGAVVLGCTGMAGHRRAVAEAAAVPVIDPCRTAAAMAAEAVG